MLPLYSADDIWRRLGNDVQGFCTYRTKGTVPDCPGVYAWYVPFRTKEKIDEIMQLYKRISLYDAKNKSAHEEVFKTEFQWQKGEIRHRSLPDYFFEQSKERKWEEIHSTMDPDQAKAFDQLFHMTSIFHRPLYIGLTNSLSTRYDQHINSSPQKNSFKSRFEAYMQEIGCDIRIHDLIFSYIAFKPNFSESQLSISQIEVLEYLLKNICSPIFGER